jgi:hypothetical protein
LPLAALFALTILTAACFRDVLLRDRQFGFRDAAHHYYPLHVRVQHEWQAGRVPLWDPWENGGQPLAGNPTAAVFYPGKLFFAALPDAWGARLYIVAHVLLAWLGARGLFRAWGNSSAAAILGATAYAFGGPVVLLYANVIYLVGAAWVPFGLWAIQRWRHTESRRSLAAFALVVAMMLLGGDPQAAYLLMIVGGVQTWLAQRQRPSAGFPVPWGKTRHRAILLASAVIITLTIAASLPNYRQFWEQWPRGPAVERLARATLLLGLTAWGAWRAHKFKQLFELVAFACLGIAIAGVQVVPTAEFVLGSTRGEAGAGLDRYGFSLVPYRIVEFLLPGILGSGYPVNASWRSVLPPRDDPTFWVPSLYMGALPLVLAVVGWRSGRRGARWLGWLVLISLLGSFGLYGAPLGWHRWLPWLDGWFPLREVREATSAHRDFRAGDGGPYWFLATFLPGFDLFRYPSKLLTWTALGIAGLAAMGWDASQHRRGRFALRLSLGLSMLPMIVGLILLVVAWSHLSKDPRGVIAARASATTGPFVSAAAFAQSAQSCVHALAGFGCAVALILLGRMRPRLVGVLAVGVLAIDLAIAQAPLIWTVPQVLFDTPPQAVQAIAEAERREPTGGPFRVHRPTVWHPFGWFRDGSADRLNEIVAFERNSLQALHNLPYDTSYTFTLGILEPESHLRLFRPWLRPVGPVLGPSLGLSADEQILYFPRKAFDAWNTRYFIVPVDGMNWRDENRAYAAFLPDAEVIAPEVAALRGAGQMEAWRQNHDWQVLRNRAALPRAWVVHDVQRIRPLSSLDARQREARIRSLWYPGDALWSEPGRRPVDLRRTAWLEVEPGERLPVQLGDAAAEAQEKVRIRHYDPQRVEIEAELAAAGLVVLADRFDRHWKLSVDGRPARILNVNLGMRGAAVAAGWHVLVYEYDKSTFWVAVWVSAAGCVVCAACGLFPKDRGRRSFPGREA